MVVYATPVVVIIIPLLFVVHGTVRDLGPLLRVY